MVGAHTSNEHRGMITISEVLRGYRVWQGTEKDVANFVKNGLHCQDTKAGKLVSRALREVVGESVGDVAHFDFLHVGAGGALGDKGVRKKGYQYLMVIVDILSSFVWME